MKTLRIEETEPTGEQTIQLAEELGKNGVTVDSKSRELLAVAVAGSASGIRAEKGTMQAASPISPTFALMQNMIGIQRSANPPDLGGILEKIYAHGLSLHAGPVPGASERWMKAAKIRCDSDPLLNAMDRSVRAVTFGNRLNEEGPRLASPIADLPNTPFEWFRENWDLITSPVWVSALPARVWADWTMTVLRLGYALSFLWEAEWYMQLARNALDNKIVPWTMAVGEVRTIIPWASMDSSVSVRDVSSVLKWKVHRGAAVRKLLVDWQKAGEFLDMNFEESCRRLSQPDMTSKLQEALSTRKAHAPLVWEAIRYTLMTRENSGGNSDYYGMLRSSGRYLTVEPGTEWVTVVASLTCIQPDNEANVADLMQSFQKMGLSPELSDVIEMLERAGLARGSADADQGVRIQSAF